MDQLTLMRFNDYLLVADVLVYCTCHHPIPFVVTNVIVSC
jgi:hypothetical protein